MHSQAQNLISLFRAIVLAAVTAFLITSATLPMPAQNSVPSTAVQAARTPQFAKRLAPPAGSPNPAHVRRGSRSGQLLGSDIYDNGPINGATDAWGINSGSVTSNTFTVGAVGAVGATAGPVKGMAFGAWVFPGDVLESVEISITSSEFGGTTYFDAVVNFAQSGCSFNQYAFNACTEISANFNGPNLAAGTYWVNLQNAVVNDGDPVYWDENSGVGCNSPDCPSLASENSVGTIPSESFTMLGNEGPPTCFGSEGNPQILHSFTQQQAGSYPGPSGVTIDNAGSLYGTTYNGGDYGEGFAYKLAHFADWLLDPLFDFFGGNNGGGPTGMIVGPNGTLYGGAQGGIQNCGTGGNQYCGVVYNLTPPPTACPTAICNWTEDVAYRFSSESDGDGVIKVSAFDQDGNLYGTTSAGGLHDAGTVFQLTPSGGGWTKTTLYSFTGGTDGSTPTQVLVGNDGSLYGTAGGGIYGQGVVFQLTPSGGQWTQSVIATFGSQGDGDPAYLVQDSSGILYGIANLPVASYGRIFLLQGSGSNWDLGEIFVRHSCMSGQPSYDHLNNLMIDAAGNLYGTGTGGFPQTTPGAEACFYNYIWEEQHEGNTYYYNDLYFRYNTYFPAAGSLAFDSSGNLYGTTSGCGTYGFGTVWQFSP